MIWGAVPAVAETQRGVISTPDGRHAPFTVGRQYLVVIAISDYEQWPPLASPVDEAKEIKDILVSRYRIDKLYELYDEQATKANILRLLAKLQHDIEIDDSLLILYAGHGHLDKTSSTGFWIPVNAGMDVFEQQNWLPHTQLRGLLANFKSMHLCVISDSCFAGDLIQATRSLPDVANPEYLHDAYSHVCRQVLTSGATETVPDASDFAHQLESALRRNRNPYLDTYTLYNDVRLGVSGSVPLLGSLAGTGHQEGASFLLFLRPDLAQPPKSLEPPGEAGPVRVDAVPKRANHLSWAAGLGASFPMVAAAEALEYVPYLWSSGRYNLSLDWGTLGLGLVAGAMWLSSNDRVASGYQLNSFPLLAELCYQTRNERGPTLSLALAGGGALSRVHFDDPAVKAFWTAKPMLLASLGLGKRVFHRFRIVGGTSFQLIFFDNHPYMGLSTEAGVEYAF
jgi:hypothetical protein